MLRRGMSLELGPDVRRLLDECELVEMDATIRVQASRLMPGSLRTLDAVHIATALVAGVAIFATLDQRQRVGAEEAGLHLVKL